MADLVTLEEYKLFLNRNYVSKEKENEEDIYFSNILIPGCSKAFQDYFNNDFQSTSRTETFSIERPETKKIFLQYKPVSSITSVTISDTTLDSDDYKLLSNEDAVILSSVLNISGQIIESYYWPLGYNNVVIVYTGGYTLERGDKLSICAFMKKVDAAFKSTGEAEETIFRNLSDMEKGLLFTNFKNYYV